jgi:hypothetical protein
VAGRDSSGKPAIVQDGDPSVAFVVGDETNPQVAIADVWETGGRVIALDQGGDAPPPFSLEPRAHGAKILNVELLPSEPAGGAAEEGWHTTATIDVDVVIDGSVQLYLPDLPPVALEVGDVVVQRGTNHRWQALGARHLRMVTVMLAVHR